MTKEIPAHAKAKGAAEGPCEASSPENNPIAEAACRDVYQGTFIPPDSCDWYSTNSSALLGEDNRYQLYFNGHYLFKWDDAGIITSTLLDYEPVRCIDRYYDMTIDPNDPRCQIPLG